MVHKFIKKQTKKQTKKQIKKQTRKYRRGGSCTIQYSTMNSRIINELENLLNGLTNERNKYIERKEITRQLVR